MCLITVPQCTITFRGGHRSFEFSMAFSYFRLTFDRVDLLYVTSSRDKAMTRTIWTTGRGRRRTSRLGVSRPVTNALVFRGVGRACYEPDRVSEKTFAFSGYCTRTGQGLIDEKLNGGRRRSFCSLLFFTKIKIASRKPTSRPDLNDRNDVASCFHNRFRRFPVLAIASSLRQNVGLV